jgi:ABC-type glycerol-3-phosphate transport system substrate-binding protein
MSSTYGQAEYAVGGWAVPARKEAATDPRVAGNRLLSQSAAQAPKGIRNPAIHPKYPQVEQKLLDAMQDTISGNKTARQALDQFVVEANKVLKQA